ncbi:conserved hypothetical protein, partial [Ixodes scapularis]
DRTYCSQEIADESPTHPVNEYSMYPSNCRRIRMHPANHRRITNAPRKPPTYPRCGWKIVDEHPTHPLSHRHTSPVNVPSSTAARVRGTRVPQRPPSPRRPSPRTRPPTSRRQHGTPDHCPRPARTGPTLRPARRRRRLRPLSCAACASRAGNVRPRGSRRRSPSRPGGRPPPPRRPRPPRCRRRPPPGPCPAAGPRTCSGAGCSAHAKGPPACPQWTHIGPTSVLGINKAVEQTVRLIESVSPFLMQ